jgi:hypothetical protein
MIWRAIFSALLKPVLYVATLAASWFGGRKSAQTDAKLEVVEHNLKVVRKAEEIEDGVEVLSPDALRVRSRVWVRKPDR